jgi:hypothetical protein
MFGGNGGIPRFIIGNPKHLEGLGSLGGPNGFKPPPLGYNGCPTKILSTFMGISVCTLTSYVSLGIWGINFIPTTIWVGVITNGALVTITID